MKKKLIFLAQAVLFLALLVTVLQPIQNLMARKSLEGVWNMTDKVGGFYNEPENEFDVMFFGSSHAYASISPLRLWEDTGIKSYVFATQQQPVWATYTYLKEALKTQSPSLVVVECQMALSDEDYHEEGVTYSYMDDLRFSPDKVALAWHSAPDMEGRVELLFNFIKYHGRWSELTEADWDFDRSTLRDPFKGHVVLWRQDADQSRPQIENIREARPLTEKNAYWLERIEQLCRERGVELWLVKAPSNLLEEEKRRLNTIEEMAGAWGIPFHDFNEDYDAMGMTEEMFYDTHHLDGVGAALFTDFFAAYLTACRPDLTGGGMDDADWQADADGYEARLREME